ncbi:hypothetical protein [Streptomyces sp. NPDC096339]|uniref:hypothetical protein n=1 Tax=Streptomyces sp. NPDC096339 TaxID=3366086 RepID=UPI0038028B3F
MSERTTGAGAGTGAETDVDAGQELLASVRPPRETNRKAVSLIAAGLGAAVLAGGGFWASARLDAADRTAEARYWTPAGRSSASESKPAPTVPPNELVAKLLPMEFGDALGPDMGGEGNNFYVSGERALHTLRDSGSGLSGGERADRDKALAGLKLKGLAGRSFFTQRERVVTEVELMQADPKALAGLSEVNKKLLDVLEKVSGKRQAPAVDGFPQAKCVLFDVVDPRPEREEKTKLDSLECLAVEGDVLVSFRTYGYVISVDSSVALFKKQLNHLKSPGESV